MSVFDHFVGLMLKDSNIFESAPALDLFLATEHLHPWENEAALVKWPGKKETVSCEKKLLGQSTATNIRNLETWKKGTAYGTLPSGCF